MFQNFGIESLQIEISQVDLITLHDGYLKSNAIYQIRGWKSYGYDKRNCLNELSVNPETVIAKVENNTEKIKYLKFSTLKVKYKLII